MKESFYIDNSREDTHSKTLEVIQAENAELVVRAEQELELIAPALRELVLKIESERPDTVVFLDKGARILGTPIMHILRSRNTDLNWNPTLLFFNDQNLKDCFMSPKNKPSQYTEGILFTLRNQHVFFVDETTSSGLGAMALTSIEKQYNIKTSYAALTYDPDKQTTSKRISDIFEHSYGLTEQQATEKLDTLQNQLSSNPHISLGFVEHGILFTKDASKLYIQETPITNQTELRYQKISDDQYEEAYTYLDFDDVEERVLVNETSNMYAIRPKEHIPIGTVNPNRKHNGVPSGKTWSEYDQLVRNENMATIKKLKRLIVEKTKEALEHE